jgi:signal peptidase I
MRWKGPFRRGEIILFQGPDSVRVSRIVGVQGDRISNRSGTPIINGESAVRAPKGRALFSDYQGSQSAAMFAERLPGEVSAHRVLDAGTSEFDDTEEVVVPAGYLFVLGDNRDRSADSRVPRELGGVGMVPLSAVIGRPMYVHWSSDRGRIGTRLDGY